MSIEKLDSKIESIIKRTVKFYYTDWKNYDRPKYMRFKAEKPDHIYLIARTCGTYLLSDEEIANNESSRSIYEYFTNQEPANIYDIQIKPGTITKIQ